MRRLLPILLWLPLVAFASPEFHLNGDRLTLNAQGQPLADLLRNFSHAGVKVQVDPSIDTRVTAVFDDEPVEDVVERVVRPYGYVLVWDVIGGPLGSLPRLAEIHVFRAGQKASMKRIDDVGGNFRIATGPTGGSPFVADEILVRLSDGVTVEDFRHLLAQIGGTVVGSVPSLGLYQVRLMPGVNVPALVDQLKKNGMIDGVEPNYVTKLPDPVAGEADDFGASPPAIGHGAAKVAILDSGLLPQVNFGSTIAGRYDAIEPGRTLGDSAGHGTQMAMIASGTVAPSGGTRGDGVPVVAIRAFDDNGYTSNYALMRALNYAIDEGARVLNMSWGTETRSQFIAESIAYAQNHGLVVVSSVGNEPTGRPVYPSAYPGVVAVSALNSDGSSWNRSNFGSSVMLSAPGRATFTVGNRGPPGGYAGTSIASAYVARQFALYFSAHPQSTAQEAIKTFQQAVTDQGARGRDAHYGFGALDAAAVGRLLAK